jgi:Rrf2 family protein
MTPPATAKVTPIRPTATEAAGAQRRHNEGHGRRLTAAFEALEAFPALAESRDRLLRLVTAERISPGDVVAAVESDVALVIAVLRLANQVEGRTRGRVESVVEAVDLLSPEAVQGLAARARTFDFFERSSVWDAAPERFRLHGVATQRAADRLATEAGFEHRDRLMVTALLHDIGKLVLMHAYPGYPGQVHGNARTPEERIHRERRELGVDHSLVGGVLARRWGLPKSLASVIERHHADDAVGEAAFVRLADMLAHYSQGGAVSPTELLKCARTIGLGPTELRSVMYDLPYPAGQRTRQIDPCPRALAVDQHGPHSPPQHLRQARRRRPRSGRPDRHRARLALASPLTGRLSAPAGPVRADSIAREPMLSITTKSPYALRALAELGRSGEGPVPIGELARRRDIPVQFLEQLFAVLRRAGVLRSQRGVKGGYAFARAPHEITVLEIVELLDGPLGREAQGIFADAATAARDVFASATIADIVEREAREAGAAMYYI